MKTRLNKPLSIWIALASGMVNAVVAASSDPVSFHDGFEGPTLNPFWSVTERSGRIILPSTTQVHSGSQAVQLSTTNSADHKNLILAHQFAKPQYGEVSVWVYDSGANMVSGNYLVLRLINSASGRTAAIAADDSSLPGTSENYRHIAFDNVGDAFSPIRRTVAWHQFRIRSTPDELTLSVDGTVIFTGNRGTPFDGLDFYESGPLWRPPLTAYFDDFSFEAIPMLQLQVRVSQVELCWQTTSNLFYQLEYKDSEGGGDWLPFGGPIRGDGGRQCTNDAVLPGQPRRFYRATLIRNPALP